MKQENGGGINLNKVQDRVTRATRILLVLHKLLSSSVKLI